jgi:hypothetical protein
MSVFIAQNCEITYIENRSPDETELKKVQQIIAAMRPAKNEEMV